MSPGCLSSDPLNNNFSALSWHSSNVKNGKRGNNLHAIMHAWLLENVTSIIIFKPILFLARIYEKRMHIEEMAVPRTLDGMYVCEWTLR